MNWMILPLKRYADFNGRSQRMEYWMYMLGYVIVMTLLAMLTFAGLPWADIFAEVEAANQGTTLDEDAQPGILFWIGLSLLGIFWLGTVIPSIAVTVRRFHDQDKSGWLYLLYFVPYVGGLIILVFMCIEGTRGPNRFGDDPKDPGAAGVFE